MAQLVALMSGVVLGGVAEVVGSNLARGKIFTASIGSVDSLYPFVYIYIYIYKYMYVPAHEVLVLIALVSFERARIFAANIHRVYMMMKT